MGRGRQKAKHTKVARELKYFSPDTDYASLEAELKSKPENGDDDFGKPTSWDDEREVDLDEER